MDQSESQGPVVDPEAGRSWNKSLFETKNIFSYSDSNLSIGKNNEIYHRKGENSESIQERCAATTIQEAMSRSLVDTRHDFMEQQSHDQIQSTIGSSHNLEQQFL